MMGRGLSTSQTLYLNYPYFKCRSCQSGEVILKSGKLTHPKSSFCEEFDQGFIAFDKRLRITKDREHDLPDLLSACARRVTSRRFNYVLATLKVEWYSPLNCL